MARHKITIESDDIDELVRKLRQEFSKLETGAAATTHPVKIIGKRTCEVCSFEAVEKRGIGKNGKPYHGIFCETGNKQHTKWLDD